MVSNGLHDLEKALSAGFVGAAVSFVAGQIYFTTEDLLGLVRYAVCYKKAVPSALYTLPSRHFGDQMIPSALSWPSSSPVVVLLPQTRFSPTYSQCTAS